MNDFVKRPNVTAATRGETQQGEHGDKIPGFDPAAAPLETDSEAGVATEVLTDPLAADAAIRHSGPSQATTQNAPSHADAMRPFDAEATTRPGMLVTGFIVVALALLLVAALLAW